MENINWADLQTLAFKIGKKYGLHNDTAEDAASDAICRMYESVTNGNGNNKGDKLLHWLRKSVKGHIQHYIRKEKKIAEKEVRIMSTDENGNEINLIELHGVTKQSTTKELEAQFKTALVRLTITEQEVILDQYNGVPAGETAKRLNVSNPRISQIRKIALNKIKEYVA